MDQRLDASSPSPPSSPPTDGSYQTPAVASVTHLDPVPEEVQLPSPLTSKEAPLPVPPPHATTPGREVSGQRCWTRRKIDQAPGSGASGRLFWRSSGLRGKDHARPYPAEHREAKDSAGDWRLRAEQLLSSSELGSSSSRSLHAPFRGVSLQALPYGWKSILPSRSPRD